MLLFILAFALVLGELFNLLYFFEFVDQFLQLLLKSDILLDKLLLLVRLAGPHRNRLAGIAFGMRLRAIEPGCILLVCNVIADRDAVVKNLLVDLLRVTHFFLVLIKERNMAYCDFNHKICCSFFSFSSSSSFFWTEMAHYALSHLLNINFLFFSIDQTVNCRRAGERGLYLLRGPLKIFRIHWGECLSMELIIIIYAFIYMGEVCEDRIILPIYLLVYLIKILF